MNVYPFPYPAIKGPNFTCTFSGRGMAMIAFWVFVVTCNGVKVVGISQG